ncbi:MAG: DUF4278 domain-containing protein [Symploca sp. SIO3C6]|nr:DUF4278 domain-containing protein [Symploca sp. SIO3C6]
MKLTYRGVKYEAEPSKLAVAQGKIGGKYRGLNWRLHHPLELPKPEPVYNLKYRGVPYCTGQGSITKRPKSVAKPAATLRRNQRQKVLEQIKAVHLTNIRCTLERRMQVAKAQGDEQLVRLLEAEQMAFPWQ